MLWAAWTPEQARIAMWVLDNEEAEKRKEERKKHPYYRS